VIPAHRGDQQPCGALPRHADTRGPGQGLPRAAREDPEAATHLRGGTQAHRSDPDAPGQEVSLLHFHSVCTGIPQENHRYKRKRA